MHHHLLNDNILRSALASKLSYLTNCKKTINNPVVKQLQGIVPNTVTTCKIVEKKTGAQFYVYESGGNSKLIAFRGTHSFDGFAKYCNQRMSSFHIRGHKVKVHNHILNMFESIESDLYEIVSSKNNYTFCGHSAGGGIAHFAAAYFSDIYNGNVNIKCHTFGCPKIGNESFVYWHDKQLEDTLDLLHDNDIINYLPFDSKYKDFTKVLKIKPCPKVSNPIVAHNMDTYLSSIGILCQSKNI
jgi:hypothetical protein